MAKNESNQRDNTVPAKAETKRDSHASPGPEKECSAHIEPSSNSSSCSAELSPSYSANPEVEFRESDSSASFHDHSRASAALLAGASGLIAASCQSSQDENQVDASSDSSNESNSDGSASDKNDSDQTGDDSSSTSDDDDESESDSDSSSDDDASENSSDDDDDDDDNDDDSDDMYLDVNGTKYKVDADPNRTLLDILRHELRLTGTKYGCGEGQCGACTVRMDGTAIRSCLLPLQSCWGKKFQTIEGLEESGQLHPVQQAFIDEGAMQCGYCTAGMIMSAVTVLDANPAPNDAQILAGMTGNICRCGTYPRIVKAIKRASRGMKGE